MYNLKNNLRIGWLNVLKNILEIIVRVLKFSIHLQSSFAVELYLQLVLFQAGVCERCHEKIKKDLKRECEKIAQIELSIFFIAMAYAGFAIWIIRSIESARYIKTVLYLLGFTMGLPILMRVKAILKSKKNNDLSLVCFPDEIIKRVKFAPFELFGLGGIILILGQIFGVDEKAAILFFIEFYILAEISLGISRKLSNR